MVLGCLGVLKDEKLTTEITEEKVKELGNLGVEELKYR